MRPQRRRSMPRTTAFVDRNAPPSDVSITSSFQQSYGFSTTYGYSTGNPYETPDQVSAAMNFSLGLRTNPKRIVNLNMGFGLTEDASDVTLGFSMPIDFVVSDK